MEFSESAVKNSLVFAINGERFEVSDIHPSTTLLEFLRLRTPFKGAKLSCGEGFSFFLHLSTLLFYFYLLQCSYIHLLWSYASLFLSVSSIPHLGFLFLCRIYGSLNFLYLLVIIACL